MFFWICDVPPMTLCAAVEIGLERDVVGVDGRVRSRHGQRRGADALLDPRHEQLVDRTAGPVLDAVEALGQPAAHVQPEHLRLCTCAQTTASR